MSSISMSHTTVHQVLRKHEPKPHDGQAISRHPTARRSDMHHLDALPCFTGAETLEVQTLQITKRLSDDITGDTVVATQ